MRRLFPRPAPPRDPAAVAAAREAAPTRRWPRPSAADVLLLGGFAVLLGGVTLVSRAVALILAGVGCMTLGVLLALARPARSPHARS